MDLIYTILGLFIAWIWIDYFRMIDIFEREKLGSLLLTFFLGCLSVFLVFLIHKWMPWLHEWRSNGHWLNDFLRITVTIGMLEEFVKLLPFLIMLTFNSKVFNEPLD